MTPLECTECGQEIDDWADDGPDHYQGVNPFHERCCPVCHPELTEP